MIINGPMGVGGVPEAFLLFFRRCPDPDHAVLVLNLIHSRTGRAIMAVRDNKIAAESIGLSVTRYKLLAFVISAVFAGMAGTLYAMNFSTVTAPNSTLIPRSSFWYSSFWAVLEISGAPSSPLHF